MLWLHQEKWIGTVEEPISTTQLYVIAPRICHKERQNTTVQHAMEKMAEVKDMAKEEMEEVIVRQKKGRGFEGKENINVHA